MLKWLWLSLVVIVLDQLTKYLATDLLVYAEPVAVIPFFNLTLLHNTGAAFSFLSDAGGWQRWFFAVIAIVFSIGITIWLGRLDSKQRWLAIALSLVVGGALGNLWDRLYFGYVVDFIQLYYEQWYWPAFNIADSAIFVGAVMLLIDGFFGNSSESEKDGPSGTVIQ
ncbi:MAG: signal peptidase II [Gammaproteobacteria bacterium]|nr:signal peptidase II [Gammaproteobacteria bacterium]